MSIEEVAMAMAAHGFVSTHSSMTRPHGALVQQAGFRSASAPLYEEAITAYFRKPDALSAVTVDALCGPQVSLDGLRPVGRVPSELAEQFRGYAQGGGMVPAVSVEGDAISEELGLLEDIGL